MDWYKQTPEEIAKSLETDLEAGISSNKAEARILKYGENKLKEAEKKPFTQKLLDQILDPMVIILITASILSMFIGEIVDAIVIISIVILNGTLSIYQEGKAEDSVAALQRMSSPDAKVIRNGVATTVKSSELVPGDLVLLETGDIVPADLRLISSYNLKIDESSFTGESVSVEKHFEKTYSEDKGIGDRENYAYSSTIVTYGHGSGIVTETNEHTEIGKIATTISSFEEEETPLQKKLSVLSKQLGMLVIGVAVFVFVLGLIAQNEILNILMTAVSLAVAAIPEGMTAVVTIVLSMGMNRMAARNAIVKKLLSVETLGTTTVICSDKTGTLTQNEMTVTVAYTNDEIYSFSGNGYEPTGDVLCDNKPIEIKNTPILRTMASIAALANDAKISDEKGQYTCIGDPTEGALITMAMKLEMTSEELNTAYPRIAEIPFDSDRKMMTTFHEHFIDGKITSFTKGAPDLVIDRCDYILLDSEIVPFTKDLKNKVLDKNSEFAKQALRCLAYAYRTFDEMPKKQDQKTEIIETHMIFVGLTGMIDPPRPEVKAAIEECKSAGITTIMITGDYLETAYAIGHELGIADSFDQAMMGSELNDLSPEEIQKIVKTKRIFARVSPENKVQIVDALKANGEIAAMTGDGVNDAPAIKRADIGIAMGITGTDVAKDTAEVILTDDNFATIVGAVKEGRIIYSNIKKFVSFLLSCNVGEVIVIAAAMIIDIFLLFSGSGHRFPTPLSPIMLLWLNLVTDSLPALALGVEPGESDNMKRPPRDPKEPIIDKEMKNSIVVQSLAIGISTLVAFAIGYFIFGNTAYNDAIAAGESIDFALNEKLIEGQTMAFATLILAELLRALACRSDSHTLFEIGIMSNKSMVRAIVIGVLLLLVVLYIPFLRSLFDVSFMTLKEWIPTLILSIIPFAAAEIHQAMSK